MIDWLPNALITNDPEHKTFLEETYRYAAFRSDDDSTQNGSLLILSDKSFVGGANHFVDGVQRTPERLERPEKYNYFVHAERDAIFNAALLGYSGTSEATLYCTWYACTDCARAIIQCGIRRVIGHKAMFDMTPDRWRETIQKAFVMLGEAGVETWVYDGKIFENDEIQLKFNGSSWCP